MQWSLRNGKIFDQLIVYFTTSVIIVTYQQTGLLKTVKLAITQKAIMESNKCSYKDCKEQRLRSRKYNDWDMPRCARHNVCFYCKRNTDWNLYVCQVCDEVNNQRLELKEDE